MTTLGDGSLIYLDYAATTPVDKKVADKMLEYLTIDGIFGNPASRTHGIGWQAEAAVEDARLAIGETINADSREIIFTSGATESDNLAIKGIAEAYGKKDQAIKGHIITSKIEHKAVLDTCKQLEQQGFEVTYLIPQQTTGLILPEQIQNALRDDTILVSLMLVNNEIGTITDVTSIGNMLKAKNQQGHGAVFHVDAAQAIGKLAVDVKAMNIDLLSMSGHKAYAPKGIGALYVSIDPHPLADGQRLQLHAQIHGGGHERGMRSGTLPTHQIVAMGKAFELVKQDYAKNQAHALKLKKMLWDGVKDIKGIQLNGDYNNSVGNIINIGFGLVINGVEAQSWMMSLPNLAVSSGSACNSATVAPSFVLSAIGLPDELALASIRFSFGRYTTEQHINDAIAQIYKAVDNLKKLSTL